MVVADAESPGPVRKKARLSLKKGSNSSVTNTPTSVADKEEPLVAKEVSESLTSGDGSADGETCTVNNESVVVPAVTSLENLGNTCFLNSVLQVLRFTPDFLDRLDDLYQELVQTEKLKKEELEKLNEGDDDEDDEYVSPQTCVLVKFLHKLYRSMERREEKHPDVATCDVMSMAIKPEKILNTIRELNPMFEGSLQHDAQELLRCILCYLQDAEKEVLKLKNSLPPAISPHSTKQINPIMQNFLTLGKGDKSSKTDNSPVLCTEKIDTELNTLSSEFKNKTDVSASKSDILEQIDASETALTGGGVENVSPLKNPECQVADEPIKRLENKENCKNSNNINTKRTRKRNYAGKKSRNLQENIDNCNANENHSSEKDFSESQKTNQPSIMSMLKGSASCKRLGMHGAVVKPKRNGSEALSPETIVPGINGTDDHKNIEQTSNCQNELGPSKNSVKMEVESPSKESPKKTCSRNSESKSLESTVLFNGVPVQNSPVKNGLPNHIIKNSPLKNGVPIVKLENCDHVCDSPKKSVSAFLATQTLSPMPSKSSLKRGSPVNMVKKLDFSRQMKASQVKEEKAKKKDFVEKLFMGTLMLRTTCMECEFSREKIEEFHDISVAVRKEKKDESDDEEEDEDELENEEEKGPSLPKLMESFSEVERLNGDNKYFCDKCQHLVEAERSLHYNVLPDVLSVHLKRFSTATGIFGYVSKINDHIRIPLSLPCLRHKCPRPCSRSDHRYRLYALIAHAGVTLTSGHYLAYVRVNSSNISGSQDGKLLAAKSQAFGAFNSQSQRALSGSPVTPMGGKLSKYVKIPSQKYEDCWLECDDEAIKVYSEDKFCDMLNGVEGSLLGTPYVLFYHRQNVM